MHILIFHQYFGSYEAAGGTRTYEIGRRLLARGHRVTIVSGNTIYSTGGEAANVPLLWKRGLIDGIEVVWIRVPFGNRRNILLRILGFLWFIPASALASLFVRSPDIVLATSTPLTIGIPALFVARVRRIPFVFEIRDLWPDYVAELKVVTNGIVLRIAYWLEAFLYRQADAIVALTKGFRDQLKRKNVPAHKVAVISHGANLDMFCPDGPQLDLKELSGIPDDAFVCAYAGSTGLAHGVRYLLEPMSLLRPRKNIHLVLLITGPEKGELMLLAKTMQLTNVHFLDPVPKKQVPLFLRRADVGLLTLRPCSLAHTMLSNKYFEYLACGCPIILNFAGEGRDELERAGAGIYAPADAPLEFAAAIEGLADSPETVKRMARSARNLAEARHGWEHKVDQYERLLRAVVTGSDAQEDADERLIAC